MMESSRWQNTSRRLQMLNTLSLTMITRAAETFLIQNSRPDYIATQYRVLMEKEAATAEDVHKRMKALRRLIAVSSKTVPETLESWVEAATEYQLLTHGIKSNGRITALEEGFFSARS